MGSKLLGKIGREIARRKRRKKLTNHDFTIISNSCIGGVISNSLKERFNSPTINLMFWPEEFILFCINLKEYVRCPIEQPDKSEVMHLSVSYPVGMIRGSKYGLPDLTLRFIHYSSFDEAKKKWEERVKRIKYDNMYIAMEVGMNADEKLLDEFAALPFSNKVFLTERFDLERWPNNYNFSFYTDELYAVGNVYNSFFIGLAQYRWLDEFDYTTWLNCGKIQSEERIKKYIHSYLLKQESR